MGAVANSQGVCRVELPHYQLDELESLLTWESKGAVRDDSLFEQLIDLSRDYFNAKQVDFSQIQCDLPCEKTFSGKALRACREIPYGQTLSYSALAMRIGNEDAARAVATAMSKNKIPLVVPCHRVVYANGTAGGFSAAGGVQMKQRMLELELKKA